MTPINLFSASWEYLTISTVSIPKLNVSFNITAINNSSDAEDERPAPFGMFPYTNISRPCSMLLPLSCITFATPFG